MDVFLELTSLFRNTPMVSTKQRTCRKHRPEVAVKTEDQNRLSRPIFKITFKEVNFCDASPFNTVTRIPINVHYSTNQELPSINTFFPALFQNCWFQTNLKRKNKRQSKPLKYIKRDRWCSCWCPDWLWWLQFVQKSINKALTTSRHNFGITPLRSRVIHCSEVNVRNSSN